MGTLMVTAVNSRDDAVPALQRERHPPCERWFNINPVCNSVVCEFYGIRYFKIGQSFPRSTAVFPLYTNLPTFRGFPDVSIRSMFYIHVRPVNGRFIFPVADYSSQ